MTTVVAEQPTPIRLEDSRLVPALRDNLLSVLAVDRKGGAVIFVQGHCYLFQDGADVIESGLLSLAAVTGEVNNQEQYVVHTKSQEASASVAEVQNTDEAQPWHRRFTHLGLENLKRATQVVDGIPKSVAKAERVKGTVCAPCAEGKMV